MPGRADDLIPTRRSLLHRLKNLDDSDSWREFFECYWKLIHGVAIKSGLTEVEAQEVVQETVINVSRKMPGFDYDPAKGSFKGWLMRLTYWRIKDQLRKRLREAGGHRERGTNSTSVLDRIPDPDGYGIEKVWDEEWRKHIIALALAKVKRKVRPVQYQIFDLCAIKQWPPQKVAESLGVTANQVYLARHRVGQLVRKEIDALEKTMV